MLLTRLSPESIRSPEAFERLEREAMQRIREECPDIVWLNNCAVWAVQEGRPE